MPATLSAIAPVPGATATAAPPTGALLAQAEQVVVPSGVCAPHVPQNAMGIPPCQIRTPLDNHKQSHQAANGRYQKPQFKAIAKLLPALRLQCKALQLNPLQPASRKGGINLAH